MWWLDKNSLHVFRKMHNGMCVFVIYSDLALLTFQIWNGYFCRPVNFIKSDIKKQYADFQSRFKSQYKMGAKCHYLIDHFSHGVQIRCHNYFLDCVNFSVQNVFTYFSTENLESNQIFRDLQQIKIFLHNFVKLYNWLHDILSCFTDFFST